MLPLDKKASFAVELLVFLVLAAFLSAAILFLVKSGVLETKSSYEHVDLINTEFLPTGRTGTLALKEFVFCEQVDNKMQCLRETENFEEGDRVYVRFVVASSVSQGRVMLVRNYRMIDPRGDVVLEVDERNNYHYDSSSSNNIEEVIIVDYIPTLSGYVDGEYTVDLIVENPLINKKFRNSKTFILSPAYFPEAFQ